MKALRLFYLDLTLDYDKAMKGQELLSRQESCDGDDKSGLIIHISNGLLIMITTNQGLQNFNQQKGCCDSWRILNEVPRYCTGKCDGKRISHAYTVIFKKSEL